MTENSLVIFTKASQMLAEADTIQKTKELKDLALTAADWAKRKGMGDEAIRYANSYALAAERKMGELIAEGQEAGIVATKGRPDKYTQVVYLKELGLSLKDSSNAQQLAELPEEIFEEVREGKKTRAKAKKEIRNKATSNINNHITIKRRN